MAKKRRDQKLSFQNQPQEEEKREGENGNKKVALSEGTGEEEDQHLHGEEKEPEQQLSPPNPQNPAILRMAKKRRDQKLSSQNQPQEEEKREGENGNKKVASSEGTGEEEDQHLHGEEKEPEQQLSPPNPQNPAIASPSHSITESDSGSESVPPVQPQPKVKERKQRSNDKEEAGKDAKRARKEGNDAVADAEKEDDDAEKRKLGEDSKDPFKRVFSDEDEIVILDGMLEFTSKTGCDAYKSSDAFHQFIKNSLHADAGSYQLKEKIRRIKKKFNNNLKRGKNRRDGPAFSKDHDRQTFALSKKVWGIPEAAEEKKAATDGEVGKMKTPRIPKKTWRNITKLGEGPSTESEKGPKMGFGGKNDDDIASYVMQMLGSRGRSEELVKGMDLIGESAKAEFEEEWKEIQRAEFEIYVKRMELVAEHARLAVEAYKKASLH
ncbi:hypothetical protein RIF29_03598 [Crotalaria pallida]|uniref:Glabrous enhancer-binding protein-like DBD domain-containing protein n=1 Tax=Crotalaria pallida TaxID=3830 RepID=A0AAN9P8R5_CROPI